MLSDLWIATAKSAGTQTFYSVLSLGCRHRSMKMVALIKDLQYVQWLLFVFLGLFFLKCTKLINLYLISFRIGIGSQETVNWALWWKLFGPQPPILLFSSFPLHSSWSSWGFSETPFSHYYDFAFFFPSIIFLILKTAAGVWNVLYRDPLRMVFSYLFLLLSLI